ncbi:hypothetical protein J2Z21_009299 [Streptomyces griseochromogenes]|uniref:Uncharacterized protein n=1 Tax=Streptomyces griseochromogenes TaxID=68214 RepID=A0ABS4MA87_9ACTN|nr:hypothetical protein [Streptomyces griseochromogenes]MBP2056281.1 hypothetical protein [Streptomyces griseochromogenes]
MRQSDEAFSVPCVLPAGGLRTSIRSHHVASDRDVIEKLGRAPSADSSLLFTRAAQRRNLSGDDLALARAAREEIDQRARGIGALVERAGGIALTADECAVLRPPYGRSIHLPSPDRPYAHLAVHTGQGRVSVTPVWATTSGGNVVMSTVENRIKARATALDPLVALSVPAGIGSQLSYEVGGFVRQSPDPERELIRTLAEMYSTRKIREQSDGNYTSWDQRERNERLRLEVLAYRVRDELGDEPTFRSVPYVEALAPRYGDADLPLSSGRSSHDGFWGPDEKYTEDKPELREARDELAILGVLPQASGNGYRSLNATYGHLASFDHRGLLRCRQVGFELVNVKGEARISFLVDKRDCEVLRRVPSAAMSVAKYRSGSVWLQSQGLISLHDDPGAVRKAIRRLERRYNRAHHRLALDLSWHRRVPGGYVLATLSYQRLSSRFREAARSVRSADTGWK